MVDRIFMMFEFRAIKLCKQKSKKCYQFFQLQITYYILAFFVKKPFSGNFFFYLFTYGLARNSNIINILSTINISRENYTDLILAEHILMFLFHLVRTMFKKQETNQNLMFFFAFFKSP